MFHSLRGSPTLATLVALALPAAATAAPPSPVTATMTTADDEVPSVELRFDPAIVATADGQAALQQALRRAADRVCDAYYGPGNAPADCREEVAADANAQLDLTVAQATAGRLFASAR